MSKIASHGNFNKIFIVHIAKELQSDSETPLKEEFSENINIASEKDSRK